ncbi:MAG: HAD-IC family P-type ATPase, partial [bacterium]|nr:HAD-IC family P-type ATPase [bacterium]
MWHSVPWEEAVKKLGSNSKEGLSSEEAVERLRKFGKNSLPEEKPPSKLKILFGQIKSPLMAILIGAGFIVFGLKHYTDASVIFGAVFLNIIVGYLQENKASNSLRELKKAVKIESEVIREGNKKLISSENIVPGDIMVLNPGDKVGADARIVNSDNLKINEMALTGEWLASEKNAQILGQEEPLADRDNMVYMGTIVEEGVGRAVATATGVDTEIGKIAQLIGSTKEEKTPLQKKVAHFSRAIGGIIILISLFIFFEGILTGNSATEMFTVAVAVSVAAIPEGLPIALTVILALGMQRILKQKGLVRKLSSAETLGSTSVIVTDKTGTLTEGKMQVAEIIPVSGMTETDVLKIAALTSNAFIENPDDAMRDWVVRGRPTDKALLL